MSKKVIISGYHQRDVVMNGGRTLKTNVNVPTMYLDVKQSFEEKKNQFPVVMSDLYSTSTTYMFLVMQGRKQEQRTHKKQSVLCVVITRLSMSLNEWLTR